VPRRKLCLSLFAILCAGPLAACDHYCADLEKKVCEKLKDKRKCELIQDSTRRELLDDAACQSMLKAQPR
jgi:hypothetical protein